MTEDLWIEVNMNQKPMTIGVIYRHPVYVAHEIDDFGEALSNILHKLNINKSKFCILGDFNIDLLQINQNNKARKYANNLLAQSCKCAIDIPTRISGNSRTLLDHVYVNDFEMNIVSGVGVYDISDHFPVFIHFTSDVNPKKTSNKYFTRDLNKFCLEAFLENLNKQLELLTFDQHQPVNEQFDRFISLFLNVVNKHAPLRSLTRRKAIKS